MKRKILLLAIFLIILLPKISRSQWVQQSVPVTSGIFFDMKFVNANTGFIAHSTSKLLRTTNAGFNWDANIYYRITSICIVDSEKVYAVGNNATSSYLYKTSNRGITWDSISSAGGSYTGLHFFNRDTGVISGGNTVDNFIWRTTDGGQTKQLIASFGGSTTGKFFFLKEKINGEYYGWMYYPGGSQIRTTSNSGLIWNSLPSFFDNLNSIFFVNQDTGWATFTHEYNYVYYTTNGGLNWSQKNLPYTAQQYDIFFVNPNTGWISFLSHQRIYVTTNAGTNWGTQLVSGNSSGLLSFTDSVTGWAQSSINTISRTTNGGGPITIVNNIANSVVGNYKLYQNYPNPFNQLTIINYQLPIAGNVVIKVYDIQGRDILTIVNGRQNAGSHKVTFNAKDLNSGIYFYRITTEGYTETKKMIYMK